MASNFDFKKEWEKTKHQLLLLSQEAVEVAKKSEKELLKLSKTGKMHIDSTAVTLKIEHLYYLIGKEYVKSKRSTKAKATLEKYVKELEAVNKEAKAIKTKLSTKKKKVKKSAKKKSAK